MNAFLKVDLKKAFDTLCRGGTFVNCKIQVS